MHAITRNCLQKQKQVDCEEENSAPKLCGENHRNSKSANELTEKLFNLYNEEFVNKLCIGDRSISNINESFLNRNNGSLIRNMVTPSHIKQSRDIRERNWRAFWKVRQFSKDAKRPKLVLHNESDVVLDLCSVQRTGLLRRSLRANRQEVMALAKAEGTQCFFFIVREHLSQSFRTAFIGNYSQSKLIHVIGSNYIHYKRSDWSFDHKCDILWPVRSTTSCNLVSIIFKNKRHDNDFRVNRVNKRGTEALLKEKVSKKTNWYGHVLSGCVLVFRIYKPGRFLHNAFYYAVSVPSNRAELTVKFGY